MLWDSRPVNTPSPFQLGINSPIRLIFESSCLPQKDQRLTPRCQPSSLSCSSTVRNGSSQSSSNSDTAGSPRSSIPPYSQRLNRSGSLARRAATSSPIRDRAMRVSWVMGHGSWVSRDCHECSPLSSVSAAASNSGKGAGARLIGWRDQASLIGARSHFNRWLTKASIKSVL